MSSASLIQQHRDKKDFEKVDKHVLRIKSSVNHLTQILNDFLSLGKLEEGKVDIKIETIEIGSFLGEISEEVQSFLKDGQELIVNCPLELDHLESDSRILRNIMFNLISNASKYSEPGKAISIDCKQKEGQMLFSIKDNGIGIPKEDQKHLFDRFYRASNAGQIQGTGLGLNIVKRYVELLGGDISFHSDYGKGSTFYISIPH
jgi:signal transduction histidine kinase